MNDNKKLENMILTCVDTAKAMLEEYKLVVPFGIRSYIDNDDYKMNCPTVENNGFDWNEQIELVVSELKGFVENERIFYTILVTELSSGDETAFGLQIENELSSVLFVYPFNNIDDEWIISEPIKTDQLLARVFS